MIFITEERYAGPEIHAESWEEASKKAEELSVDVVGVIPEEVKD